MGNIIDFEKQKIKVKQKNQEEEKRKKQNKKVIRKVKRSNKLLNFNTIKFYLLLLIAISVYVIFIK
jgi:hypothetical protein